MVKCAFLLIAELVVLLTKHRNGEYGFQYDEAITLYESWR